MGLNLINSFPIFLLMIQIHLNLRFIQYRSRVLSKHRFRNLNA